MTDENFRSLCNTYGFAPSRALHELLTTATAQAKLDERRACADMVETLGIDGYGTLAIAASIRGGGKA